MSCTLFLIFINDLPDCLDVKNAMFADDLVLWITGSDTLKMQLKLNTALNNLTTYCELWKLKINCKKTVYTLFTLSNTTAKLSMNLKIQDQQISKDDNPCYLGIRLDPRLTLKTHIIDISAKVTKRLNLLKRLASTNWGSNKATLRQLYTGYIRAIFDYSAPLQLRSQPVNIIRRNLIANKMKPSDLFVVDFDLHQQVPAKLMLMWNHSASEGKDALL